MRAIFAPDGCDCDLSIGTKVPIVCDTDGSALSEFLRLRAKFTKRAQLGIDDGDDRYYVVHGPSGHVIGTTENETDGP